MWKNNKDKAVFGIRCVFIPKSFEMALKAVSGEWVTKDELFYHSKSKTHRMYRWDILYWTEFPTEVIDRLKSIDESLAEWRKGRAAIEEEMDDFMAGEHMLFE